MSRAGALEIAAARAAGPRMPQRVQSAVQRAPVRADLPPTPASSATTPRCSWRSSSTSTFAAARAGRSVFGCAKPEYRHRDHPQCRVQRPLRDAAGRPTSATGTTGSSGPAPSSGAWAEAVADATATPSRYRPIGDDDPEVGPPTQLAAVVRGGPVNIADSRLSLVVLIGVIRFGQVDVRAQALHADRRCCPPTPSAASSPTTRTTSRRPTDAFDVLHYVAGQAAGGRAASRWSTPPTCSRTRAPAWSRSRESTTCCRWPSCSTCPRGSAAERNPGRPDRDFGRPRRPAAARRPAALAAVAAAGRASARCTCCATPEEVDAARDRRRAAFNDMRDETGPFDVIGDVHGCRAELEQLLDRARLRARPRRCRPPGRRAPPGRPDGRCSSATWSTAGPTPRACCGW